MEMPLKKLVVVFFRKDGGRVYLSTRMVPRESVGTAVETDMILETDFNFDTAKRLDKGYVVVPDWYYHELVWD